LYCFYPCDSFSDLSDPSGTLRSASCRSNSSFPYEFLFELVQFFGLLISVHFPDIFSSKYAISFSSVLCMREAGCQYSYPSCLCSFTSPCILSSTFPSGAAGSALDSGGLSTCCFGSSSGSDLTGFTGFASFASTGFQVSPAPEPSQVLRYLAVLGTSGWVSGPFTVLNLPEV